MELKDLLKVMIEKDGSDLFLTTGAPPSMKGIWAIDAYDREITSTWLHKKNSLLDYERRADRRNLNIVRK